MHEAVCPLCDATYTRYSSFQKTCPSCYYASRGQVKRPATTKPLRRTPIARSRKPIKQRGKAAKQWDTFRDKVARPYLDKKYGLACVDCGSMPEQKVDGTYYRHDVDHVKGKGSHPELKFDVTNMVYRCRPCHIEKTGVPRWSTRDQRPAAETASR